MKEKTAVLPAQNAASPGERRRSARSKLPCFILVRPYESGPDYFENIIITDNSSRHGLAFETDNDAYCQRMRLLVTYPYSAHHGAINRDYIAEVTRRDTLPDGRFSVAVRFLTTAKLSVPPPSSLHATEIWSMLLRTATAASTRRPRKTG